MREQPQRPPRVSAARWSLKLRVMLAAGLAVALVLLVDAVFRHIEMERDGKHGLVERALLLASIQGNALSVPMWNLDEDQVGAALDALAADADFVSASVTKPDGTILRARWASPSGTADEGPGSTINVDHGISYLSHGEQRNLGTLHLSLSTRRLRAALAAELEQRVAAFVVLLAAVLLSVFGALRTFTRPLEMMATALTRLAAGDRDTPIPASDQDNEVGEVARALQVFRDTAFRLTKAEASYRALFENAALGIYGTDEKGHMVSCNAALLRICGYPDQASLSEVLETGPKGSFYVAPGRGSEVLRMMRSDQGFEGAVSEIRRGDGSTVWVSQTARAVRDETGKVLAFAGTLEDITDRLRRQGEERLRVRAAMESASDAILIVDEAGEALFANPAFVQAFGCNKEGAGQIRFLLDMLDDGMAAAELARALRDGLPWEGEAEVPSIHGGIKPMLIRASAIRDAGGASFGAVVICTDLSDRRRAEARIQHMAHHDWLTGLPNRALLRERLNAALMAASPAGAQDQVSFAVLCIDLDRFKAINDSLGHAAGDALLQRVAERLEGLVREGDTVARIGGDEFTLIQLGIRGAEQAMALADRLITELGQPYDLGGREVQIGASVGIVLAPLHGNDLDSLLSFGDVALYHAKSLGRCRYSLFAPEMNDLQRERAELETDLRRAVAESQLHLHFQPQFDLAGGRMVGAEALLRWTHPERGPVPPSEFVPIAEESGLIIALGKWVMATACAMASAWPPDIRVAVNVSPAQFHAGDLVETVRMILAASGLAADRLELEITEGVFMLDSELTRTTLMELKALGVRITLDDFGTGYSSLSYLRRMPLDKIKVDRSFVAALGHDPAALAVVRSIIGLAKVLGLETNAEGVETKAQAQMLRDEGCQEVQGFYFGHPVEGNAFLNTYRRRLTAQVSAVPA